MNSNRIYKTSIILILFAVVYSFILYNNNKKEPLPYQSEIVVRTVKNLTHYSDVDSFIDMSVKHDISIISVAFKQDEDDGISSGEVFYPSAIAPTAKGYESLDILKYLIKKAHEHNIHVKAWIPQFHDQIAYNKNPNWRMMFAQDGQVQPFTNNGAEFFVNPLHDEVQQYELSIIKEIVSNYDVDSIVLDWIRFDDYNMDLSDYTRAKYESEFGYDPLTIDFNSDNNQRDNWSNWRNKGISSYIELVHNEVRLIKPDVEIGVYVLSPEWDEVGQDPELFHSFIDFISPMSYYDDWGYPLDWITGPRDDAILLVTKNKVHGKNMIPVFDTDWELSDYNTIFASLRTSYPKIKTISWFEYGKWSPESLQKIQKLSIKNKEHIGADED